MTKPATTHHRLAPNAEVDAAFRATAERCLVDLAQTLATMDARIKLMAITVQTTRGPITMLSGCTCQDCGIAVITQLGRALGGSVEMDQVPNADSAGVVH